ncbi:hypothetical protein [Methanolobus bombayensis]|uniref:hypothetical protein n=1 Tax=Methanolobus bombayensis TaxID=38023 RepID=UPI001AE332CE|nr:hypothetical protein [Methanolobus bombayensis]MBP1908252.1 hypothetical protein [Methanolobus bombayensis]
MSNEDFILQIKQQAKSEQLVKNGICEICGETNPYALKIYENHHISTRGFSDETRVLCLNCHAAVTHFQNELPPKFRSSQLPLEERLDYVLLTHAALRKRMDEIEIDLLRKRYEGIKNE